MKKKIKDVME